MLDEDKDFERGMALLNENPPKLKEALSIFKNVKAIYEQKGRIKEQNSVNDKISYIYRLLSMKEYDVANVKLRNTKYKDAIIHAIQSQKYLFLSDSKNPEKISRKLKSLIENSIIELLYDVENRTRKNGYTDDILNEIKFLEKTIIDIFYPKLKIKKIGMDNELIPENIVAKIGNMKKIQQYLINAYEMLANQAVSKSQELIETGNIEDALKLIDLANKLYNDVNSKEKAKELINTYVKIYEAQGDVKFLRGKQLAEDGRLDKAREYMKQAKFLYKKAENDKKEKMSKKNYLEISTKLGEQIIKMGDEAAGLYHLKEAIGYYEKSYDFFSKLKHPKFPQVCEKKIKELYNILGEKELKDAESITPDSVLQSNLEKKILQLEEKYKTIMDFSIDTELLLRKLALYHDALFNFRKANNSSMEHKTDKIIHEYSEKIGDLLSDLAKKQIKNNLLEQAYLNLNKSEEYYNSIGKNRKVNSIRGQMEKLYKKIDLNKLNKLKEKKIEIANLEQLNSQNQFDTFLLSTDQLEYTNQFDNSESISTENSILSNNEKKENLYRCKVCGEWVRAQYYDSFQEKCVKHRTRIFCDECGNEILANVIYQSCVSCGSKFCENCWDRVYDFVQKKCSSCRVIQNCALCGRESQLNQVFDKCPLCGQDFCEEHWDSNQNLCINCRKNITCKTCGKEISGEKIFTCTTCMETFCENHFDKNRKQCLNDRREELCAKCGSSIKSDEPAFKCPQCGFMYCRDHFSVFHNKCHKCLPGPNLVCYECNKSLYDENFYRCIDCNNYFCSVHYNISEQRCDSCLELASICKICHKHLDSDSERFKCTNCNQYFCAKDYNSEKSLCTNCLSSVLTPTVQIYPSFENQILEEEKDVSEQETPEFSVSIHPVENTTLDIENTQETKPDPKVLHLEANTLKKLADKYNNGSNLNVDEINFLLNHSINLPKDENKYLHLGDIGDIMVVLKDSEGISYVGIVSDYPIIEHCRYYGDLIKKLTQYFPEVRETIDGKSCIINLLFYSANIPHWNKIYELLRQTLLKGGIETINVLRHIFKKSPVKIISDAILKSPFESLFTGINLNESIKFIQTEEPENEVGIFSENDRLDRILRAFYNLHRGDVIRAAEMLSIFEIKS